MSETATAEAGYYAHTLTHRPLQAVQRYKPYPDLAHITSQLLTLPFEIRVRIYSHAFHGNRVAVTSTRGCYCATTQKGPYRDEHHWLFRLPAVSELKREAQWAFVREALWEIHCEKAFDTFVVHLSDLSHASDRGVLTQVRHLRINVFETSLDSWTVDTEIFGPALKSVIFGPWQKGWTIDITDAVENPDALSDQNLMVRVNHIIDTKPGYEFLRRARDRARAQRGGWKPFFLFPIRYHVKNKDGKKRWQLRVS